MKQQHMERKLSKKVYDRIDAMQREEREKVKQGKKPFYPKKSAICKRQKVIIIG